jgi:XRE family transcriptional regulator, regulator of sulfur utilization
MLPAMGEREKLQIFGAIVRKRRTEQGLSQESLANLAGLHRTYISMLERGIRNPSLTVILQIAEALDTRAATLMADLETKVTNSARDLK